MSLLPFVVVIMVFAIPILGILLAGYKEWLKFKSKHRELGTSTREVEEHLQSLRERLERIEQEREALRERVQNLETIVTSEAWIAQHDDATESLPLAPIETETLEPSPEGELESGSEAERTAEIARRLRNT